MKIFYLILILPTLFWTPITETLSNESESKRASEWLLHIHPDYTIDRVLSELEKDGLKLQYIRRVTRNMDLYLVSYSGALSHDDLRTRVFGSRLVKNISANAPVQFRDSRPDDILYGSEQANMETIKAPVVWDRTKGGLTPNGDQIVVAVIDGAFQIDHVDLVDNLWAFEDEIAGDGIDNDGNGYVDDVHGWNTVDALPIVPVQHYHGTGVAGIVGARGNNEIGVTGINWDVKVLPISVGVPPSTTVASILDGYDYVVNQRKLYNESNGEKGAYIVASNSSFGVENSDVMENASWCEFYDMMGAEGILNVAASTNTNDDVESLGDIPSLCTSRDLLVVNNTSPGDLFVGSGFSEELVDIGAPGSGVTSLTNSNNYAVLGGTSSSSPHVAGAIALMYSLPCPNLGSIMRSNPQGFMGLVKNAILDGVDPLASLSGKNVTGGRLNLSKTADILLERCDNDIPNGDLAIGRVYPVPVRDDILTIEYQSPDTEQACISLYDGLGKFIKTFETDPQTLGVKEFRIDDLEVPAGVYFLRFPCVNPKLTHSIVVQ